MKKFLPFALLLLLGSCKKDLLHWQKVQRINTHTAYRLNHIHFTDANTCLIGGGEIFNQAIVLRSADGGFTWVLDSFPQVGKAMFGLGTAPGGAIYMCGVDGTVLHTADTGKTWQFDRINDWQHYVGVSYATPDTGVYVSTVLQRQCTITEVDNQFNIISSHTWLFGLNDVYMTSPSTGYVIGYGAVMKTTDHRKTWNFQDVKGDNFTAMDIHGDEIWMCGANGSIYHTTDGGGKWHTMRNGNDITIPHFVLYSIVFKDSQHGWACGDDGKVIYTDDGGSHWMEYDQFTTAALRSIVLCPNGDLLTAGDNGQMFRITPL